MKITNSNDHKFDFLSNGKKGSLRIKGINKNTAEVFITGNFSHDMLHMLKNIDNIFLRAWYWEESDFSDFMTISDNVIGLDITRINCKKYCGLENFINTKTFIYLAPPIKNKSLDLTKYNNLEEIAMFWYKSNDYPKKGFPLETFMIPTLKKIQLYNFYDSFDYLCNKRIDSLEIEKGDFIDIDSIANARNLRKLRLQDIKGLQYINGIENLNNLKELSINGEHSVVDFDCLKGLVNLSSVNISGPKNVLLIEDDISWIFKFENLIDFGYGSIIKNINFEEIFKIRTLENINLKSSCRIDEHYLLKLSQSLGRKIYWICQIKNKDNYQISISFKEKLHSSIGVSYFYDDSGELKSSINNNKKIII